VTDQIALLGAGFSRNWGGWLADEVFEYLLGDKNIQAKPDICRLLWETRPKGGFEVALSELQIAARRSERFAAENYDVLRRSVEAMFEDMNMFSSNRDRWISQMTAQPASLSSWPASMPFSL
jgi:hypothetical protein